MRKFVGVGACFVASGAAHEFILWRLCDGGTGMSAVGGVQARPTYEWFMFFVLQTPLVMMRVPERVGALRVPKVPAPIATLITLVRLVCRLSPRRVILSQFFSPRFSVVISSKTDGRQKHVRCACCVAVACCCPSTRRAVSWRLPTSCSSRRLCDRGWTRGSCGTSPAT